MHICPLPLTTGALWYDPTQQHSQIPRPPPSYQDYKPEPRPLPKPTPVEGERYNLAEVLQLTSTCGVCIWIVRPGIVSRLR